MALGALLALMLLPVYHKAYDAAVLLLPFAWSLRQSATPGAPRRQALLLIALLSVFLVPFNLLPLAMQRTHALDAFAQTALWRIVIYPHHALGAPQQSAEVRRDPGPD